MITAETVLLSDQEAAVNFTMQRMLASIQLIKALGGDWDASQIPSPKELGARFARIRWALTPHIIEIRNQAGDLLHRLERS